VNRGWTRHPCVVRDRSAMGVSVSRTVMHTCKACRIRHWLTQNARSACCRA